VRFDHTVDFDTPLDQAWDLLTDVRRVAPAMPGAQLREVRDDEFIGAFKVKIGPVLASYEARAHFELVDVASRRIVLSATGSDPRGLGGFAATVTADLSDGPGTSTRAHLVTELAITGRVAQFGTPVVQSVSAKLLETFIGNLGEEMSSVRREPVTSAPQSPTSGAIDLGRLALPPAPSATTLWLCTLAFAAGWLLSRRARQVRPRQDSNLRPADQNWARALLQNDANGL
jgi:carbon monoxide dehydrogenase subunit G